MIVFDGATKTYGAGTVALDDLHLDCPTGRITVLVGTSGGGKTTALRMINRMVEPTSGRVLIDGTDVRSRNAAQLRRQTGYVIQQAGLFPHRTIVDNVATVPFLLGAKRAPARTAALALMERVGLPASFADRYPYQLSGGQQQRVGVARALAADPPVLLMDEPFSAVDPVVRAELQRSLLLLQDDIGKTIVFVTHDVDEAIRLGDLIAVFASGGRLAQVDTPATLLARPVDSYVASFLGLDRGIRSLSFVPASRLRLSADLVLSDRSTAEDRRAAAAAAGAVHRVLVLDDARRPLGWLRPERLPPTGPLSALPVEPLGHVFTIDRDSLRAALDASVLSPCGCAAGVDSDGRVVGLATAEELAVQMHRSSDSRSVEPQPVEPAR